ncbi:hypothetical protein [Kamptonema sp. UHCC 0994]|uniref:hypothetical protein n=1 Tax=Kamptonema sp. UHCC 0994 TaxID=3031329 RepID=UPI0023B9FDCA|nr:hypothetical protein [Kamptonema sp. UHCC 0994]MDF0552120.1 hypothetical protein [Kamptonema sp. UHCC 0994]
MKDFLLTVTVYGEFSQDPLQCKLMSDQLKELGLNDYLINDIGEWTALPDNIYADWVEGEDCDLVIAEWNLKIAALFRSNKLKGFCFITVGTEAVWFSQGFW